MKFITQKRVRFHHCDPAGIVFYPQFFYLLHEVQEDFLTHIGFPEHLLIQSGTGLPIVDLKAEFLGMCRHGDHLTLSLELTRLGGASMGMRYEIHGGPGTPDAPQSIRLRAEGVVVFSSLADAKAVAMPDGLRAALQPYLESATEDHA